MGAVAEAGCTWAPLQERAARGRRRRSGRHVAPLQERADRGSRRRSGRHVVAVAEAGGTWAPFFYPAGLGCGDPVRREVDYHVPETF